MLDLNLSGKTALVSGASKGIGRATAIELADLGATVIGLARNQQELQKLVAELPTPNNQHHDFIACDLTNHAELRSCVLEKLKNCTITILINNAGGPKPGPISEATAEQFIQAMQMHLLANVTLTELLLPGMRREQYGRIINIISTSVKSPIDGLGVSNTTRWAVAAWAKTLSYEVAKDGITVNDILPGFTATERLKQLFEHQAAQNDISFEAMQAKSINTIPAKRLGEAKEIAAAIAFLATPAAAYINGVALAVDGGRTQTL